MNKKEQLKSRVNFLYYEESLTQKEIAKTLKLSRQRINAILNSNEDHKVRKLKRIEDKTISRKVQFHHNYTPTIAIPKDMFMKIGINEGDRIVDIKVEGQKIIIKKS